jgi:hypothetical protein
LGDEPPRDPPGPASDEFDPKQHIWDGRDWWTLDRRYWWDGSVWREGPRPPEAPRPPFVSTPARRRDFWLGFTGWLLINGLAELVIVNLLSSTGAFATLAWGLLILNIVVPVVLAIRRSRIALGALTAFGCALAISVVEGTVAAASDFSAGMAVFNQIYLVAWIPLLILGAWRLYALWDRSR